MTIDNSVDRGIDSSLAVEASKLEMPPKEEESQELELQQRWEDVGRAAEGISRDLRVYFSDQSDSLVAIHAGLSHLLESGLMPNSARVRFHVQDSFDTFKQSLEEATSFSSEMGALINFYSSTTPEDFIKNAQDVVGKMGDLEGREKILYTSWLSQIENMENTLGSLNTVAEQNYDLLGGDTVDEIRMTSSRIFAGTEEVKLGLNSLQSHFDSMKESVIQFLEVSTVKK